LPAAPLRIECFDISHIQGTNVVGSMVVFEDGLARKSEYRRFIIKSFQGNNDEAAMAEVLTRRLKRLQTGDDPADAETGAAKRFSYRPSLIVIDGGLPQVNAIQAVFEQMEVTGISLIGLAKRLEEVWRPAAKNPVVLPRASEGLFLLQRLRDEAHRFAITFHRQRRGKAMVQSILDEVPGLGDSRQAALYKAYPSLKKLRQASVDDLAAVPGVGPKTAQAIVAVLGNLSSRPTLNTATGEIME